MNEQPFHQGGDSDTPWFRGVYRENVASLLMRRDGRVLLGKCADDDLEWQFPQGGVDEDETRREAMLRELYEETKVRKSMVRVIAARSGYQYTFPNGRLKKGVFCGQRQTYFLCAFMGSDELLERTVSPTPEFSEFEWVDPAEFPLDRTPEFKHLVYRAVMRDFFKVDLA